MKKLIFCIIATCTSISFYGQLAVTGIIKDEQGNPVPFASIGYFNKKAGGISDKDGTFSIRRYTGDSIKISAIGFESAKVFIDSSKQHLTLTLYHKAETLSEIILEQRKKAKGKTSLGYFGLNGRTFTDRGNLEVQQAYFIPNERQIKGYINEVKFKLRELDNQGLSLRIRLIEIDTITGFPGEDLLLENLIINPKQLKRNTSINLRTLNIKLPKEGIFISLEWLCLQEKCKDIFAKNIPALPGGLVTTKNGRYLNYKEIAWQPTPFQIDGFYAIPGIGITVSY